MGNNSKFTIKTCNINATPCDTDAVVSPLITVYGIFYFCFRNIFSLHSTWCNLLLFSFTIKIRLRK